MIAVAALGSVACEQKLSTKGAGGPEDAGSDLSFAPGEATDGTVDDDALVCSEQVYHAEPLPIDVFLVVDSSTTMILPLPGAPAGTTKWTAIRDAVAAFITDPRSKGLGVGIQYFPLTVLVTKVCSDDTQCGDRGRCETEPYKGCAGSQVNGSFRKCQTDDQCLGGTCVVLGVCTNVNLNCEHVGDVCPNGGGQCQKSVGFCLVKGTGGLTCDRLEYATPVAPIADVPADALKLINSLGRNPRGESSMGPAVAGSIDYLRARTLKSGRTAVMVLVGDGAPNACAPLDFAGIAGLLTAGRTQAGMPVIKSFVIGVYGDGQAGAGQANLDMLAVAGGTDKAYSLTPGTNLTQDLIKSLSEIRNNALPCEYPIPPPPMSTPNQMLDFSRVNISFKGSGGTMETVGHVMSQMCHPTMGGWYYDVEPDTGKPTKMVLCGDMCKRFKQDPGGAVEIRVGCKTKLIE